METIIWRLQVQSWLQASNNTGILNTCTRLWLTESEEETLRGFNKGRSSNFRKGSRVRQTPEEVRRTYRLKCCGNNNKDEDNSPKPPNDKNECAFFFKKINYLIKKKDGKFFCIYLTESNILLKYKINSFQTLWLIDWLWLHVNLSRVILYKKFSNRAHCTFIFAFFV